jgi:hypothetical protein
MDELYFVYATAALIVAYALWQIATGRFDPFAPTWLFFVGYIQVYVVQAFTCHDWGVGLRGRALVTAANWRALWALAWFLIVYHLGPGRWIAPVMPRPPRAWSSSWISALCPLLVVWGTVCSVLTVRSGEESAGSSAESLLHAFPFWLLVAGILLIVTGRTIAGARPAFLLPGLACAGAYVLIWMFNGKRSHSLMAVLTTICAVYVSRLRRPSWPVLFATAFAGALVVTVAIGWRCDRDHERSVAGFVGFLADFRFSTILANLNLTEGDEEITSYETWEYGGFLLMMDTVPEKSDYDYGANYLRTFSTFIPRLVWPEKPLYGRRQWIAAWQAGSELERDDDFASPSIGILGATQLNGGAVATLIVIGCIALLLRTSYEFFRLYAHLPWAQFWWSITFYNAWFMVVGDDPMTWFYYNYGYSALPIVVLIWLVNRSGVPLAGDHDALMTLPQPSGHSIPWECATTMRA